MQGPRHPQRTLDAYRAAFPKLAHRGCTKAEGETFHVERWFGTLRTRVSRLSHKTYSCSKHPEEPLDAIRFFIATYNMQIL